MRLSSIGMQLGAERKWGRSGSHSGSTFFQLLVLNDLDLKRAHVAGMTAAVVASFRANTPVRCHGT